MEELTEKSLLDRLVAEFNYPKQGAELVFQKISAMESSIRSEFDRWWHTGSVPNLEVEGYSIAVLMSEHNMNPIAAFLTLDWLLREPERAVASLIRGHDQVRKKP